MTDWKKGIIDRGSKFVIYHWKLSLIVLGMITLFFLYFAIQIPFGTMLEDLIPKHPYMETNRKFKESFGGSNIVTILLEVKEGNIFQVRILEKIKAITDGLRMVDGVNYETILSLASKQIQRVRASTTTVSIEALMFPSVPQEPDKIEQLRKEVLSNPTVYGSYVSLDLKAALITTDFYDYLLNPVTVSNQIENLIKPLREEGVEISVVGNPILYGLVNHYVPQTMWILLISLIIMFVVLRLSLNNLSKTIIVFINIVVSTIWTLGFATLVGLNFDPLVIVIALLIIARVVSQSLQSIIRGANELKKYRSTYDAAEATLREKWLPGVLAVLTDSGGVLIVAITPIPLLTKIALIAFIWLITIPVTCIIQTNILLSQLRDLKTWESNPILGSLFEWITDKIASISLRKRSRYVLLAITVVICGIGAYSIRFLNIGDANPGTPILWPNSSYNQTISKINKNFLGSNKMFLVVSGDKSGEKEGALKEEDAFKGGDVLKEPDVLQNIEKFQRFAQTLPEISGTISLVDLIGSISQTMNEDDPRFNQISEEKATNGEYLYYFTRSPEALTRFCDQSFNNASVTLFFQDHKGDTIRNVMNSIGGFIEKNKMAKAEYKLAGGEIGLLAATNEVIGRDVIRSIALAFLMCIFLCNLTYKRYDAGTLLVVPIVISNILTYAYMGLKDIGLNINSLPVAALGIGVGIDYGIYIADNIKQLYAHNGNLEESIKESLKDSGLSVLLTVFILVIGLSVFLFSSLRFQAEMALLIAIWMTIAAIGGLFIIPTLVIIFRPGFLLNGGERKLQ